MTAFRERFPNISGDDVPGAVALYEHALASKTGYRWRAVSARATATGPIRDFELCVYTDDPDAAAARLRHGRAEELRPRQLEPWGERRPYFRAPDRTLVHIAQAA